MPNKAWSIALLCFTLFSGLLIPIRSNAQDVIFDSIKSTIFKAEEDSTRIRLILLELDKYLSKSPKLALKFSDEAEAMAIKNKWINKKAQTLLLRSRIYARKGVLDSSLLYGQEALLVFQNLRDLNGEFQARANLGSCYFAAEDFKNAIEKFLWALELEKELEEKKFLSSVYGSLGLAYQYTGSFQKALSNHLIGLKLREKLSDKMGIAASHDNLGINYFELGDYETALQHYNLALDIYKELNDSTQMLRRRYSIGGAFYGKGEYDLALEYLNGALSLAKRIKKTSIEISCYQVIGLVHVKREEFLKAEKLFQKAESIFPENGSDRMLIYLKTNIAVLYLNWGTKVNKDRLIHLRKAKSVANETFDLTEKSGILQLKKKAIEVLYKANEELGDYKEALEYMKNYVDLKDSLLSQEKQKDMLALEAKYETEKKDLKIDILSKDAELSNLVLAKTKESQARQQNIIYSLLAAAVGLLILGLLIFRLYKQKQKNNSKLVEQYSIILSQKEENEILLKEIHHRVKNNLQIISSLLDLQSRGANDENTKMAVNDGQNRVRAMSLIHEMLYQNENMAEIDIKKYVGQLFSQIISINSDLGSKKIEQQIEIPDNLNLDIDTAIPLGLILTELLTNSFKYAFEDVQKGFISVELKKEGAAKYIMQVSDNGCGLPEDFQLNKTKTLGLRLVKTLSKQLKGKVDYSFEKGAKFVLKFQSVPKSEVNG